MIFTGRELVFKKMTECDLPFYEVLNGNELIDQCQDENMTAQNAAEQLKECLDMITGSFVTVKISGKTKKQKAQGRDYSLHTYNVKLGGANQVINNSEAGIGGVERSLMKEISDLKAELIETKYQQQLKALEEKFDRMQKDKGEDNAIGKIAEALIMNYMAPQGNTPKPVVGIAGMEATAEPEVIDNKQRFASAIKTLQANDKYFIATLEALAKYCVNNPSQYATYVTLLKAQ